GWELNNIRIENTDRFVALRDNTVTGQMVLNWIGDRAHVQGNEINDLRVNQNQRRTGMPTSGVIAHNTFRVVGQLRHWDGLFERNTVGSADALGSRAVNFDGFNGARFRNNTIRGYMDARLHGHHHSSGFSGSSHQHSGEGHAHAVDHTKRYHRVSITNNVITTTADYALAYLDTNHAGNDRTAPSEQEEALREPHVHHTRVSIAANELRGAGLLVNVFNADDKQKHPETATGSVELRDNVVTLGPDDFWSFRDLYGIEVKQARDLDLVIDGNEISGRKDDDGFFGNFDGDRNAGIFVHALDAADIWITDNSVKQRAFGVRAEQFSETVSWVIRGLRTTNVDDAVYQDESVKDSPAS
ncbi:MAG: hypothetical protein ACRDKJ_13105, partial [Actinomycetota bacterium]